MVPAIEAVLQRYQRDISHTMRHVFTVVRTAGTEVHTGLLEPFYGQMYYHLGWVDRYFAPTVGNPGKLLRPTLLLLTYEMCSTGELSPAAADRSEDTSESMPHIRRALSAAAAIEFVHNFTLLHDDIEDGDTERRHRATVWRLWGVPQAINTGDGMCVLARLALWESRYAGVEPATLVNLARILDEAVLQLTEGQYLDISFEASPAISIALYMEMIGLKTAALMRCATEMGVLLSTDEKTLLEPLRHFGWSLGLAFQVRDDMLGVWASEETLGKQQAGDIYRRKKSLPIVHALAHADAQDWQRLQEIYEQQDVPVTPEQVRLVLEVLEQAGTWAYCAAYLRGLCQQARAALAAVPTSTGERSDRARKDLLTIVDFVEATVHNGPFQQI